MADDAPLTDEQMEEVEPVEWDPSTVDPNVEGTEGYKEVTDDSSDNSGDGEVRPSDPIS